MSQVEERASQLKNEAQKKLSSRGILQFLFGSSRTEQAIDCFQRAGNLYKMSKNWREATGVFNEAAHLSLKRGYEFEAANGYINAAKCCKQYDVTEAIGIMLRAIDIFVGMGKFMVAARHHQTIAELYENEQMNVPKALEHYEIASEYYKMDDNFASAKACLIKVADHSSLKENYKKASEIFKQIADYELSCAILKLSAKDHFFKSILCKFCMDENGPRLIEQVKNFASRCPLFEGGKEHQLILTISDCINEFDVAKFEEAVKNFDTTTRLSTWHVTMLLRIKRGIIEELDLR